MLSRLFPPQVDNHYHGYRTALWLLGLFIAVKLAMTVNSIFNTATVAERADGFPLASFSPAAASAVLMLFALMMLGHLMLALVSLTVLIRYRAMVPFIFLVLLAEQIARREIVSAFAVQRSGDTSAAVYVNYGLMALLTVGLVLSLLQRRSNASTKMNASR